MVDDGWGAPVVAQNQPAPDAGWGDPVTPKPEQETAEKPMPGFFEALGQGVQAGTQSLQQGITALSTVPQPVEESSPAAQPYEWRDLAEPSRLLAKTGYGAARSWPVIGGGALAGEAGAYVGGPWGGIVGGAGGAATAAALQTLGPEFANEAKRTPDDLDGAWNRAVKRSVISGAFSAAGWAAFPLRPFLNGPVKNLAFQVLGVQPAIGMAEKATSNLTEGQPLTQGMGQAYAQSAVGTAVPALGHLLPVRRTGDKGLGQIEQRTPAQDTVLQSAQQKHMNADVLDAYAQQPGLTTDQVYNLRTQAEMIRQDARHENFLANIPPAQPDPGVVKGTIFRNFLPEFTSEKATQMAPRFAEFASGRAQDYDSTLARAQEIRNAWDWVPQRDIQRWFDAYETAAPIPPDLRAKYPFMQRDRGLLEKWLKDAYFDENDAGSRADFLQNYFPHIFKNPTAATDFFQNLTTPGTQGATWFQKARYYDLISHALQNGLELKTWNPVDLVSMRLMSGADMRAKMGLLSDLYDKGVAVPVTEAPNFLTNNMRQPQPWKQIDAPNGTRWLVAPDISALWENAVVSKGLWADPGLIGRTFRGWMGFKALWVPIKLGASLFHPVHVALINVANNVTRGLHETFKAGDQGIVRRMIAMPEAALQSATDWLLAAPIGTPFLGKEVRAAWKLPASQWSPRQQYLMDLYREAGASPQLAEQLKSQGKLQFHNALVKAFGPDSTPGQRAIGIPEAFTYRLAQKVMGYVSAPFFEHWIPNLKAAALIRQAEMQFRRRPDLMQDAVKRKLALNTIAKSVDNRFGEMFYNGLFWNRTIKDAAIGGFLSLGWNLGFAREYVGGMLEPFTQRMMSAPTPSRALIRDVSTKSTNLLAYFIAAATLNAMVQKLFTGEDAQGIDYAFPKAGGTNTDGTPRRFSTPHYTREIPMVEKNIEDQGGNVAYGLAQTLWHKMMIAPVIEAFQNRDYFGGEMYDPRAPGYMQAKQFLTHMVGEQLNPMSVAGAKHALQLSGKPTDWRSMANAFMHGDSDVVMPFLGYGPAPSYAGRTALENRIYAYGRQYVFPAEKPFAEARQFEDRLEAMTAYKVATKNNDQTAIAEAAKKMADLGMTSKQIKNVKPEPSAPKIFQRLGQVAPSVQVDLLKGMTKDEFRVYYPKASKAAKQDKAIIPLAQEYYRQK